MSHHTTVQSGCSVLPPLNETKTPKPSHPKRRAGVSSGRFQTLNTFVDVTLCTLDGASAKVWLILFRDTKPDGLVRVSQADLARRSGFCPRTARRAIGVLMNRGLVTVVKQGRLGSGPSVYIVRALPADRRVLPHEDKSGQTQRSRVSPVPERDQKETLTPSESVSQPKKKTSKHTGGDQ